MRKSIRQSLIIWLAILLGLIWIISALGGSILALRFANDTFDRELLNSADSITARVRVKNDKLMVDLPPAAQAILRHDNIDHFYYQVISSTGKRLSGDTILPPPVLSFSTEKPLFRDARIGKTKIRMAEIRTSAEGLQEEVIIQVAETLTSRKQLSQSILLTLTVTQMLMAIFGATAVWLAVGAGLKPLSQLQRAISSRSPHDLSTIDDTISPEETYQLVKAINGLLDILREDTKAKQRFIANASHQLRTPLAVLKTYSSIGVKTETKEEMVKMVEQIDRGLDRTSHLVTQLLALARNDAPSGTIATDEKIDLNFVASDVVEQQVQQAIKRDIELGFESAQAPAMVSGDRIGIQQLIDNLIDNALKYAPVGGKVQVAIEVVDKSVTFVVRDNAPRIASDERARIFERFYRIDGSPSGGSGLGLAIVKDVADNHSAAITVEPGLGDTGNTFKVAFPRL